MTFSNAVAVGFSKFFYPYGRASRSEYWWYILALFIFAVCASFIFLIIEHAPWGVTFVSVFGGIVDLVLTITSTIAAIRRLHDIGKSGWNVCWSLIPLVGAIYVLYLLLQPSQQGPNKYGEQPE